MPPPELSACVIVWGGQHNLPKLLPALAAQLEDLVGNFEIIVSADTDLQEISEQFGAVFVRSDGSSYGRILRAALAATTGEFVVTMDGDFSHRPAYVRTMWYHREIADVLIGSRYTHGSYAEMAFVRRILSKMLNFAYRKILALPQQDLSSGFRLLRREVLDDIGEPEADGLDALLEMAVKASCQGWKIAEVPFWFQGARPWTRARALKLGIGFIKTFARLLGLRNSVKAADYDHRAFDSWIPLQRYWHRRRFRIIQGYVGDSDWVLDIGCGSSRIVQTLPKVVAYDIAIRKLRWLRFPGRHLVRGDMNYLPFKDRSFDTLICSEVIEHIPRDKLRFDELIRVVRPGGLLIIGTPDYGGWLWPALEWLYGKVFPGGYVHEHVNPYTRAELHAQLEEMGLQILDVQYVGKAAMIFKARLPRERGAAHPSKGEAGSQETKPAASAS